jgi:hypothetical protein
LAGTPWQGPRRQHTAFRGRATVSKPYLRGWAAVESPSDEDWREVKMALVSGRLIPFRMDLYQPLYAPRPLVVPELFASLRPPAYSGAMEPAKPAAPEAAAPREAKEHLEQLKDNLAGFGALRAGSQRKAGGAGTYAGEVREELARRPDLGASVASAAAASQLGDFFQYVVERPVTLPRQKSALLPIVGKDVEASRVSIYNEGAQPKFPLLCLKVKNTSGLHLMQGPVTVRCMGVAPGRTVERGSAGEVLRLRADRFVIGRSEGDFLIPHDLLISARHLEITRHRVGEQYRWVLTDLQTTNGLFIRVSRTALADKAKLLVGTGRYRFEAPGGSLPETLDALPPDAPHGSTRPLGTDAATLQQPTLVELAGGKVLSRLPLAKPEYWIGSGPDCPICQAGDPFVEPRHARVYRDADGAWHAQNNKAPNGLWIKVPRLTVTDSCLFQIGEQRFRLNAGG